MEQLRELFLRQLPYVKLDFTRGIMEEINWNTRLIGIKGARGIGKTTLLLQYIKLHLSDRLDEVLYVNLDYFWIRDTTLVELVKSFEQKGGKFLFLDNVHKYPGWEQELKSIYDDYPDLKIVFTGSSLLDTLHVRADLGGNAVIYDMQGFSFREYIGIETGIHFDRLSLPELLTEHTDRARAINEQIKPFQHFGNYLKNGYYPYFREEPDLYFWRLTEMLNLTLEVELPLLRRINIASVSKIKQLLAVVAGSVPYKPNVSKISEKIGISRTTLLSYLHYLDEISLTRNLFKSGAGSSLLQKPSKIYLENTNLLYLLANENANRGNLRETFFANQIGFSHNLSYGEKGDFFVDNEYTFEIGGKDKTGRQLKGVEKAYIVSDDITHGFHRKIPLWLFGFLY